VARGRAITKLPKSVRNHIFLFFRRRHGSHWPATDLGDLLCLSQAGHFACRPTESPPTLSNLLQLAHRNSIAFEPPGAGDGPEPNGDSLMPFPLMVCVLKRLIIPPCLGRPYGF
jgi:hypothetical protein